MELSPGWLSPTGEFVRCSSYDHICVSSEIVEKLELPEIRNRAGRMLSDDERLMQAGWVYIGISSFGRREWRIGWRIRLSAEQARLLRLYFEDGCGIPVNEVAISKWKDEGWQ